MTDPDAKMSARKRAFTKLWIGVAAATGTAVLGTFVYIRLMRPEARIMVHLGLQNMHGRSLEHARAHDGMFPPPALDEGGFYLRFSTEERDAGASGRSSPVASADDTTRPEDIVVNRPEQYFYLGYAVTSDSEGAALLDALRRHIERGNDTFEDLAAPEGSGTAGTGTLFRLRANLDHVVTNAADPRRTPIAPSAAPCPYLSNVRRAARTIARRYYGWTDA